jgi:hypothetical protein
LASEQGEALYDLPGISLYPRGYKMFDETLFKKIFFSDHELISVVPLFLISIAMMFRQVIVVRLHASQMNNSSIFVLMESLMMMLKLL